MEAIKPAQTEDRTTWLDKPILNNKQLNLEVFIFTIIFIAAIFTRFYLLEPRVMSHDETSHVYFSWRLSQGAGYMHDPVTHGPLQFHLIALSYFIFGDNDFTARIPAVLFSIATVGFIWFYRRYLGRAGTLIGAVLFTISPYMLYYGRYVRNEALVAFFGVVTIWAILRYIETGHHRYLYFLTAATVFHVTAKETSYIYTAQMLLFLAFYFIYRITRKPWNDPNLYKRFIWSLIAALGLLAAAIIFYALSDNPVTAGFARPATIFMAVLALTALVAAAYFAIQGLTLAGIRRERSFDLLMLQGTLVLPLLTAFPLNILGVDIPNSATDLQAMSTFQMIEMGIGLLVMFMLAIGLGIWWNRDLWIGNAALFFGVFVVLFTTIFTNGAGIFTGLLGGLGYWLEQQPVQRGSQPWYYYIFLQIPIYEYLAALGSLMAVGLALAGKRLGSLINTPGQNPDAPIDNQQLEYPDRPEQPPVFPLLAFWSLTSIIAYTVAGEKMPWLTVHIALPLLLLAALGIGFLVDSFDWGALWKRRGALVLALLPVFLTALVMAFTILLGPNRPFQGRELAQLQSTSTFITASIAAVISGWAIIYLLRGWAAGAIFRLFSLAAFAFLGLLTARHAFMASYINYDNATEYLIYAHSGPGIKTALSQIEELSRRTTDGLVMQLAYDDKTTYPYWWYLRNYPNLRYYHDSPTRDLREVPAILVGDQNYSKIEPIVGQAYYSFEYIRIWWPNQDYYFLTWERIRNALTDPLMRSALWQIWLNRDYTLYGQQTNKDMSLPRWEPAERMRLYLRKDITAQLWEYGTGPALEEVVADPYEGGQISLAADVILGGTGDAPRMFNMPRNLAAASDGTLYISDTNNHRIQHLARDGSVLHTWGSYFSSAGGGQPPAGTFDEPWGIAVGPDGFVYVTDTWNHRIQKFTADGEFVSMWGTLGQAETPFALWGPRGIAVNSQNQILVADTGNKRILIFDSNGNYIAQFGSAGFGPGQFDEPVGLAIDDDGQVYVTDTWNQRVQVFAPGGDGQYVPVRSWDIVGWYGSSLDNKPFIAVDQDGQVFVSDPEGYRILQFSGDGQFVLSWGDAGIGDDRFRLPTGLAADPDGGIWVTDAGNGRIMHFSLP
jgi:uncharacterized protein (TIGR03663 family)